MKKFEMNYERSCRKAQLVITGVQVLVMLVASVLTMVLMFAVENHRDYLQDTTATIGGELIAGAVMLICVFKLLEYAGNFAYNLIEERAWETYQNYAPLDVDCCEAVAHVDDLGIVTVTYANGRIEKKASLASFIRDYVKENN